MAIFPNIFTNSTNVFIDLNFLIFFDVLNTKVTSWPFEINTR